MENTITNNQNDQINWGSSKELIIIIFASLMAGFIAKIPNLTGLDEEFFYPRNISFIILPLLTAYTAWRNSLSLSKVVALIAVVATSVIFINLLPADETQTLVLSCVHMVLFMWAVLGFSYVGDLKGSLHKRLDYLKFSGDLAVMTALILIAGGIMSAITIALFELIDLKIEEIYFNYVGIFGLSAAPIVASFLVNSNPQLVGKVSPTIAKIFTPLVLIMLTVYLTAILFSGKDPYNDREFLMIFNALLIGVMALIFFSLSASSGESAKRREAWTLLLLSVVTIIINGIALSAIVFRIGEWGFTPNRTAVLGANLLFLINLILVSIKLIKTATKSGDTSDAKRVIALYLPLYVIWSAIVTFLFPIIFWFK